MPQFRQSGQHQHSNASDHVAIGVRSKAGRARRSGRTERVRLLYGLSITSIVSVLCVVLFLALSMFYFLSLDSKELGTGELEDYDAKGDSDFLVNVTRTDSLKILKFGKDSVPGGGDSRYWERDDRRRDEDYSEDDLKHPSLVNEVQISFDGSKEVEEPEKGAEINERDVELRDKDSQTDRKMYEESADGEKPLGKIGDEHEVASSEDDDDPAESDEQDYEYNSSEIDNESHKTRNGVKASNILRNRKTDLKVSSNEGIAHKSKDRKRNLSKSKFANGVHNLFSSVSGSRQSKTKIESKKRAKRHACEMKFLNISQIVEPLQTRKFARFNLQYVEREENSNKVEKWEPKFAGHQSLEEREDSFLVNDKTIHCGFVKGPEGSPSTGFDLSEDDANYISKCHVAVVSCIFGNSDRLRPPVNKMVTRLSRKNVCFVMFMDERTLGTLTSENKMPDREGFIGLWKVVVVKNLPYTDMRRVGKVPKLLSHRLFPSARYSIWLDSKLRFQVDPLLVLEYFLWRKGNEYAISNHYDRHCVWDEVAQNKRLDKYNHTAIDEQFSFYKSDGLVKFDPLDPNKLLPSSTVVRAYSSPVSYPLIWQMFPKDPSSFAPTLPCLTSSPASGSTKSNASPPATSSVLPTPTTNFAE